MSETCFQLLIILLWLTFGSVRVYYRRKGRAERLEEEQQPQGRERFGGWISLVLMIGILGMLVTVILYAATLFVALPFIHDFHFPLPDILRWIGVVMGFMTVPFLIWIHRTLGRYYAAQLELKEEHQLITIGPYSRVRHPMYTIFILLSLSMGLISSNLLIALFSLMVVLSFPVIARKEEAMLKGLFGEKYWQYMRRTGRFFPKLRQPKEE
jgi:protein-S-isoprenylcysteine O-methyltransferase Ste14